MKTSDTDASPVELRELVKRSVAALGRVIEKEAGASSYRRIEDIRKNMAALRGEDDAASFGVLRATFDRLKALDSRAQLTIARSFTLMLELMNACENAYRSHRISSRVAQNSTAQPHVGPEAIIYVLTAHPTEARSPQSIAIFHSIQHVLAEMLTGRIPLKRLENELDHWLELAWRVPIVREQSPKVRDEAEHIYSTLLEPETLTSLLNASREIAPVYIRSWVGGDKDGHPGVDEKVMQESLSLSRALLLRFSESKIAEIRATLTALPGSGLKGELAKLPRSLRSLRVLKDGDATRVIAFRKDLSRFLSKYESRIGAVHPALRQLRQLLHVFPAMVVPLELRESADVLMSGQKLAIDRMLSKLAGISRGGDPRWYARGFIVSMTESIDPLRVAEAKVRKAFGKARLPVIPLFEEIESLKKAPEVARQMIRDSRIGKDILDHWGGALEMMLGYSDSSKDGGVFPSRLAIALAMKNLDEVCVKEKVRPIFFQGSGGSVDRGGGSVQDQTAWWPHSALRTYKVTVQGEMVERSLSSPEITRSQIARITESVSDSLRRPSVAPDLPAVSRFADRIAGCYREKVRSPDFLACVARATPYSYLSELKIGSRPTKRGAEVSLKGLRAIPWVLCWTQTRLLFPTWWGVGTAWSEATMSERAQLKRDLDRDPVFSSYVKALGFTLAKVILPVWKLYLQESGIEPMQIHALYASFENEYRLALEFVRFMSGQEDPVWFRPWLGASIRLRSPMIHPLNLLQIIALEKRDFRLFRYTVTGVASGMLTTG
jgi:phosphoenolpyruvate carboxylase